MAAVWAGTQSQSGAWRRGYTKEFRFRLYGLARLTGWQKHIAIKLDINLCAALFNGKSPLTPLIAKPMRALARENQE